MLYLLYGPDEFSIGQQLARLREQLPPDVRDFNLVALDGRKLKLDELAQACEAQPFLAERRMVIVSDALKHSKAGKERDDLRDYLGRVPPACNLIFVERGEVDKRNAIFTYLKKHADVREFAPLQGADLLRWLRERASGMGAKLDNQTAQHLVDYAGNDSRTLINELGKVATYVGRDGQITPAVINLLVADEHEHNLFAFIDDLSQRKRSAALQGVRALLAEGQATTYILYMLMRQVRILLSVQELAARRMRADDIASELKQKPFVVRKSLEQIRNFEQHELERMHDRLLETDRAIKTGQLQPEVALELFVVDVCGGKL
ncbi:MAG: DNA polymerase III subunit delta [Chloroflexaceae bacterium]|nr:DNA polymerase III subunit delta [Chloroflexaceae bacterium]